MHTCILYSYRCLVESEKAARHCSATVAQLQNFVVTDEKSFYSDIGSVLEAPGEASGAQGDDTEVGEEEGGDTEAVEEQDGDTEAVEAHTGGDGEPPRKLRKMLHAKPKPSASKPPGPPEQPLPPPPGPPPPGPPPFSPPPMPPPKIPCPPWRGVKKEPVVKQELPDELDVVDQWHPSQWDTSQWSDSGDSSQWSAGADWGSHWDGSDDSTQWGGSGGDSASAAGWRGSGNAPASGSGSANVPAGLGQKPKHLPDPTPDYEGCDYHSWTNAEMCQYWGLLTDEGRSSEYNALKRRGDWKRFRDVVFHHDDHDEGGRRRRGGGPSAFCHNKNQGWLTQAEVANYHMVKREWQNYSEL